MLFRQFSANKDGHSRESIEDLYKIYYNSTIIFVKSEKITM